MLVMRGDHQGALDEAERALATSPNLASAYGARGVALLYSGQPRQGLAALQDCLRRDPRSPARHAHLQQSIIAHYLCGEYEAAVEAAYRSIRAFPDNWPHNRWLAAALGQLGRSAEAKEVLEKAIASAPSDFDMNVRHRRPWLRPEDYEHMLDGLHKAGWQG
jgi:adenylate cyclase